MNRRLFARTALVCFLTLMTAFGLAGCHTPLYYYTQNQFGGRAIPPSGLQQRVLATYTNAGSGGAEILDGLRDLRSNVQNTIPTFSIAGFSATYPSYIINYPEQQMGYVLDSQAGTVASLNYATERSGTALISQSLGANAPSAAVAPDGTRAVGATANSGQILLYATGTQGGNYALNLPNVNKVVMNPGNSVILAMTRNSNSLYRIIQIPQTGTPVFPPGYVDCQPLLLPVYCIVPVKGSFDRPANAYFSPDGGTVYVENCGPECGGTTASLSVLNVSALTYNNIPTGVSPLDPSAPSSFATLPVANPIPIPGGVTMAISDGTNLYLSGQSLFRTTSNGALGTTPAADGLFTGYLTVMPLSSFVPGNPLSISDGTHTRMLFADDNTLWIGSSNCAVGERNHTGQNINCLTLINLGSTLTATVIPAVTPGGGASVPYPNTNGNVYYYGDLTGIAWVQNYHKVFTAYGGQIHAFYTGGAISDYNDPAYRSTPSAGTEINNSNITVQGDVLDVAYMDALTNQAN